MGKLSTLERETIVKQIQNDSDIQWPEQAQMSLLSARCSELTSSQALVEALAVADPAEASVPFNPLRPELRQCRGWPETAVCKLLHRMLVTEYVVVRIGEGLAGLDSVKSWVASIFAVYSHAVLEKQPPLLKHAIEELISLARMLSVVVGTSTDLAADLKVLEELMASRSGSSLVVKQVAFQSCPNVEGSVSWYLRPYQSYYSKFSLI